MLEESLIFHGKNSTGIIIDNNIKEFICKNEGVSDGEIINWIMYLHPFFQENKEQYLDKRDINIFKRIDFQTIDSDFTKEYQSFNFEIISKKRILQYLKLLLKKADIGQNFCFFEDLIKDKNLDKKDYMNLLNHNFDELINLVTPSDS